LKHVELQAGSSHDAAACKSFTRQKQLGAEIHSTDKHKHLLIFQLFVSENNVDLGSGGRTL